jgi:hypothetical protein
MQIVQWTIASAPSHPIALSALLRILHATGRAVEWAHDHASKVKALNDLGRYSESRKLLETDVMAEPKQGGPVGVMDWTGPGVWTDAVLRWVMRTSRQMGTADGQLSPSEIWHGLGRPQGDSRAFASGRYCHSARYVLCGSTVTRS